jgi:hypothetical protein
MNNGPALAYLKAKPSELKVRLVDTVIAMEKRTAPLRKEDDLLCRDGMAQMKAGIEAGKTKEVPTPLGQIGKTVVVDPPRDWSPKFVSPEKYKPLQDQARAAMKPNLLKLLQ